MIKDINWHENCLKNSQRGEENEAKNLERAQEQYVRIRNSNIEYAKQIAEAKRQGKTRFDKEKFMKKKARNKVSKIGVFMRMPEDKLDDGTYPYPESQDMVGLYDTQDEADERLNSLFGEYIADHTEGQFDDMTVKEVREMWRHYWDVYTKAMEVAE